MSGVIRRIPCPHCKQPTNVRKTSQITATCREVTCHCTNERCGCVFVAEITPVRILSPSAMPDPSIFIPLSRHVDVNRVTDDLFKDVKRV